MDVVRGRSKYTPVARVSSLSPDGECHTFSHGRCPTLIPFDVVICFPRV